MNPRISIITPLYNKADYVRLTIDSVLKQSFANWQMIVVENGSTDSGSEVVRSYADTRIELVESPKCGPGAARNYGLSKAIGEWVLFLDSDDLLEADHLSNLLRKSEEVPSASIIAGGWKDFAHGNPEQLTLKYPPGYPNPDLSLRDYAIAYTPWAPHAALVRRSVLKDRYIWAEQMDKLLAEDSVFWFRLVTDHLVAYCGSCSALYRFLAPGCRTDLTPNRWFEALDTVVSENIQFLAEAGKQPSAKQMEYLLSLYSGIFDQAHQYQDDITAHRALCEAEKWLRRRISAPNPPLLLRLCDAIGLPAFQKLRNLRQRFCS